MAPAASEGPPPRGILRNQGVSLVSDEQLATGVLLRFPDALALSEFRLRDDLFTYGLPGETLMQFEGSGYETDWQLEFPVATNAKGLRPLADVLITFDMLAYHSEAAAAAQAAGAAPGVSRAIMLPASAVDPKGLRSLDGAADPVRITFDPGKLQLPRQESGRQVTNLALVLVGRTTKPLTARLTAGKPAKTVAFQITTAFALQCRAAAGNRGAAAAQRAGGEGRGPAVYARDRSWRSGGRAEGALRCGAVPGVSGGAVMV